LFPNQASWLADLEAELYAFPHASHDNQVDSISQALAHEIKEYGWSQKSLDNLGRFIEGVMFEQYVRSVS